MEKTEVKRIRKILRKEFNKYTGRKLIDLSTIIEDNNDLKEILFNTVYDKNNKFMCYKLVEGSEERNFIDDVIKRVDFSKIDFSDVDLSNGELCGYKNAKIYTDSIYGNSLKNTRLYDLTFIGESLDNINISGASFIRTNNARINLDKMRIKSLRGTYCGSLEISGDLTPDFDIKYTSFNKDRHQKYIEQKQELDNQKKKLGYIGKKIQKRKEYEKIEEEANVYKLTLRIKNKLKNQE